MSDLKRRRQNGEDEGDHSPSPVPGEWEDDGRYQSHRRNPRPASDRVSDRANDPRDGKEDGRGRDGHRDERPSKPGDVVLLPPALSGVGSLALLTVETRYATRLHLSRAAYEARLGQRSRMTPEGAPRALLGNPADATSGTGSDVRGEPAGDTAAECGRVTNQRAVARSEAWPRSLSRGSRWHNEYSPCSRTGCPGRTCRAGRRSLCVTSSRDERGRDADAPESGRENHLPLFSDCSRLIWIETGGQYWRRPTACAIAEHTNAYRASLMRALCLNLCGKGEPVTSSLQGR